MVLDIFLRAIFSNQRRRARAIVDCAQQVAYRGVQWGRFPGDSAG